MRFCHGRRTSGFCAGPGFAYPLRYYLEHGKSKSALARELGVSHDAITAGRATAISIATSTTERWLSVTMSSGACCC